MAGGFVVADVVVADIVPSGTFRSLDGGAEGVDRLAPTGDLSGREEKASVNCVTAPSTPVIREANLSTSAFTEFSNLTCARWIDATVANRRWQQSATTSIASWASSLVWRVLTMTLSSLNCPCEKQ